MSWKLILSSICLMLITRVQPQFFDFFGFPPVVQNQKYGTDYTTRRTKIETLKTVDGTDSQITWKNTTISFVYEGLERDDARPTKTKRRKQTTIFPPPIFNLNFFTTTPKTVRKSNKVASSRRRNNSSNSDNNDSSKTTNYRVNSNNKRVQVTHGSDSSDSNNNANSKIIDDSNSNRRIQLSYDVPVGDIDLTKHRQNNHYSRPINNIQDYYYTERPYYEATTKPYNHDNIISGNYNNGNFNNNYYTTKSPFANHPGVRPAVIENRPPITNRPVNRPIYTERPVTNKPTTRPRRPTTTLPSTTVKTYIVNPIPTDAGALVYPHEDEPPEIIRGLDEDFMSDAEKRRYIDIAERMCEKYKSLTTKHIQAIPLLPSPEPVRVNVSQCTPTTIPLVVGGKVVTINEFPHMALLGWIKLAGPGYSWKCGASLISDQFLLTAAHCSYQERDNTVVTGPPRVAQLGSSYLDDPGALVVRIGAVVRHPKYKFPKSYYDVALLKLVQKITFSEVIKPACLGIPPPVGDPIIATGWGKTELGGDQSLELRSVSLPVWNIARCHDLLGTSRKMPEGPSSDSQMCAGEERGGKDTCQGDSGGPAQIQDGCVWRIVAVTSLGRSCGAPNTPGLYALVHRAFIAAQVFGSHRNNRDSDDRNSNSNSNNNRPTTEKYNQEYHNNRPTTEKYNQGYDGYNNQNHNRRTTTTENYQGIYREPGFTSQNGNVNNKNDNREPNYPAYTGGNTQYGSDNRGQNDYTSNNHNNNDYSQNNRENNNYGSNNERESNSRNNNRNNNDNNNKGHSYYNNNRRTRFEEGTVWFT